MDEADAQFLQVFLSKRDAACPGCGYNLRDLGGTRCPECGHELKLAVGLVEPKQAAGITGLVGLAAGAGMSGLLLIYLAIRRLIFHDGMGGTDAFLVLTSGGFIIEGVAAWMWLRNWGKLRRLGSWARWTFAAATWLLTFANLGAFSVFVR